MDAFALQAMIELDLSKLKAGLPALKRMVSDALKIGDVAKGSSSGGGSSMLSGLGKALAPLATIAGGIALLVSSSGALQGTLKGILQSVMLIVRPIGDLVAVGLMPIIAILRPIGMFFKILLAPYIAKAREAMNLGRKLQAKGEDVAAAGAYALGVTYVLKPFFDMFVSGFTILTETIAYIIKKLGDVILGGLDGILGTSMASKWDEIMNGALDIIANGGIRIINDTNAWMGDQLEIYKTHWESVKGLANVKMNGIGLEIGSGFINIITATTSYMKEVTAAVDLAKPYLIMATAEGMAGMIGSVETGFGFLVDKAKIGMSNLISGMVDTFNSFMSEKNKASSQVIWPTYSSAPQYKGAGMGGGQTIAQQYMGNITVNVKTDNVDTVIKKFSDKLRSEMRANGGP
jgi:hypothetical protein